MRAAELLDPPDWGGPGLRGFFARVDTEAGVRRLRGAVWALLVLGILGFLVEGADRPADPTVSNQTVPGAPPKLTPAAPPTTRPAPPPTLRVSRRH